MARQVIRSDLGSLLAVLELQPIPTFCHCDKAGRPVWIPSPPTLSRPVRTARQRCRLGGQLKGAAAIASIRLSL